MASWVVCGFEGVALRKRALACSRIFWICAERLGFRGTGGGGTWFGASMERRARWRALSVWSSVARAVFVGEEGEESCFVAGSRWRGRRVKVSSIIVGWLWAKR